jgi:hypothetical protein
VSTLISLVVVAGCVALTTWIVLKGSGQPATTAPGDHREPDARHPDPDGAAAPSGSAPHQPVSVEDADHGDEPRPEPEPVEEPVSVAEVELLEPEPQPEPVLAATTPRARTSVDDGAPLARGSRTRASQRVRARRRDHSHLRTGDPDAGQVVLVPPAEVPAPQPARTKPLSRLRSALTLAAIIVVVGVSVAVFLGVAVVIISDILENAVK